MVSALSFSVANGQSPLRVMTFNIRYDNPTDAEKGNGWKQRRENLVQLVRHYDPDLLGIQEAMKHQLDYLLAHLDGYEYIGVARDDGGEQGEYSAILYKVSKVTLVKDSTFWLSETPEKPSKAWDAALPRIATWGIFETKSENRRFLYVNTHFDHVGSVARANSSRLLVKKVEELAGGAPAIISGDFNATPEAEPYDILVAKFKDTRKESAAPAYGPEGTFSGFELKADADFPRIDYIFVKGFKVESHETVADFFNDKFPSDHLPVIAELKFK